MCQYNGLLFYCSFMPGQIMGKKQLNLFGICPMAACYFPVWAWVPTGAWSRSSETAWTPTGVWQIGDVYGGVADWGCLRGRGRLGMPTGAWQTGDVYGGVWLWQIPVCRWLWA